MKMGMAQAPASGYWQATVKAPTPDTSLSRRYFLRHLAESTSAPLYFEQNERMRIDDRSSGEPYEDFEHMDVTWHFAGQAVRLYTPPDPLVQSGVLRGIAQATPTACAVGQACPVTGIWQPQLRQPQAVKQDVKQDAKQAQGAAQNTQQAPQPATQHPWANVLGEPTASNAGLQAEGWKWQRFVQAGEPMPSLSAWSSLKAENVPVPGDQLVWRLMQATELGMEV
jgi:hypothetical protein